MRVRLLWAFLIGILTAGYLAPWAVAYATYAKRTMLIFWINLCLGWTVIGWFVAWILLFLDPEPLEEIKRND